MYTVEVTVEVYKRDLRYKSGERLVRKVDHTTADPSAVEAFYSQRYPATKDYRYEIHETMVRRRNFMTGREFMERYDTPYFCSPSSETYWSR
jgi:hypothetical protein